VGVIKSMSSKIKIGIDVRGLNYMIDSGVNVYTLHFLRELWILKKKHPNWVVFGVGFEQQVFEKRVLQYPFLRDVFDQKISFSQYLGLKVVISNKVLVGFCLLTNFLGIFNWKGVQKFDFLFLPQPKPILKNPLSKMVVCFHDIYGAFDLRMQGLKSNFLNHSRILKCLYQHSFLVWVNSISTGVQLEKEFGKSQKLRLVYPALPEIEPENKAQIKSERGAKIGFVDSFIQKIIKSKYLLVLSNAEPRKNWHNIVLAHKHLQTNQPDWDLSLVFAGFGFESRYLEKIKKMADKFEIKNVQFVGSVENKDKNLLIKNCQFVVYASLWEGFGFPILETFKLGKSLVLAKVGSSSEVAKEAGVYVNPLNTVDIASAMCILAKDEKFRKQKEELAKKMVSQFSWDEMGLALEKTILEN
jgi:glycosyltransferase involved in cell wall biosynthesis